MVCTHGEDGWVPYGQEGDDGESKLRAGMGLTEVTLDGWGMSFPGEGFILKFTILCNLLC